MKKHSRMLIYKLSFYAFSIYREHRSLKMHKIRKLFFPVPVSTLTLSTTPTTVMASRSINITCKTNDLVRPAANITWYKGTSAIFTQITTLIQPDANDMYRTVSVLQYTGVSEDNGQQVYCRASNIEGEHVESSRYTLNVTCK